MIVEANAGVAALIPDQAYVDAGASIGDPWLADVVVKVAAPSDGEIARLHQGQNADRIPGPPQCGRKVLSAIRGAYSSSFNAWVGHWLTA